MIYLIDTDWVIDYLKGIPRAIVLLRALAYEGAAISLITYGEIYEGIYGSLDRSGSEERFRNFLDEVSVLPLDQPIMRRFPLLRDSLRRVGRPIGDLDLLIAATALQHSLALVTRNLGHFQRISGLQLYEQNT